MPYFHHDVQIAETEIKKNLPGVYIERSDKGFGLSVYLPSVGTTVVFRRANGGEAEVRANVEAVIEKYRSVLFPKKAEPEPELAP